MTLPSPIDLEKWFDVNVEDFLVLIPTSVSPQPVHVLNGFLHGIFSGRRSPRAAIDFVATRTGGGWAISNQDLRQRSPLRLPRDDLKLDQARRAVASLIAADRAVYSGFASFQIAYPGLMTSDSTHLRIGELAARLTLHDPDGVTLLTQLMERLKEPQPNPHWALEKVLSEPEVLDHVIVESPPPIDWWGLDPAYSELATNLSQMQVRALRLAVESRDSLLGLEVLAISATWIALLVYSQVPSIYIDGRIAPLLVEAGDPGVLPSVRASSADIINLLDARFEEFLAKKLLSALHERFPDGVVSGPPAIQYIIECNETVKKLSGGTVLEAHAVHEVYGIWSQDHPAEVAMARTLQDCITSAMGNKSRDWFASVGRHCGFVGPRRGHPTRLRVEVSLVPALVLAGIEDSDGAHVPFNVWSNRLAEKFGVVFGPHAVARKMTNRAAENELETNQQALESLLTSLGLARRYSDGVTEILNPFFSWVNS